MIVVYEIYCLVDKFLANTLDVTYLKKLTIIYDSEFFKLF